MGTKIDLIKYLLNDIEKQLKLQEEYITEVKRAKKEAEKTQKYYWNFLNWVKPIPRKQKINDDLKLIRRLCLEIKEDTEKN